MSIARWLPKGGAVAYSTSPTQQRFKPVHTQWI